ncbi:MAG: site-specific integrase [Caldilineaceae bacterium]
MTSFNLQPTRSYIQASALPDVVERYIDDARLRRLKPETVASYEYLLSLLLEWWVEAGPALHYELDERAWQRYAGWLADRPNSQSGEKLSLTVQKKAVVLCRQMLKWCFRYGLLDRDYAYQLPKINGNPPLRSLPSPDDLARLMEAAGQSFRPVRDQAILAVLIGTGMRRAECAGLSVEDVEFYADGGGEIAIHQAKLDKPRRVAFDAVCGEYLLLLLDELGRQAGPLFTEWKDRRLSAKGVGEAVKRALRAAGLDQRGRGAHDLRRYFTTDWQRHRRSLGDGELLSMQLGHTGKSAQSMSVYYSRQTFDDLQSGFTSPLSRLKKPDS